MESADPREEEPQTYVPLLETTEEAGWEENDSFNETQSTLNRHACQPKWE